MHAFRGGPPRRHSTSCQLYHPTTTCPTVLTEQKRLSAALRGQTNNGNLSIIEEAFADSDLPMPPDPPPLWGPEAVPGTWSDVCGFLKSPNSYECWKVGQHDAFSIPFETLGLRSRDQSCHREVFLHLDFVTDHGDHEPRERHEPRLLKKERSAPYQRSKERCKADDESDRSLSS